MPKEVDPKEVSEEKPVEQVVQPEKIEEWSTISNKNSARKRAQTPIKEIPLASTPAALLNMVDPQDDDYGELEEGGEGGPQPSFDAQ